MNDRPILLDGHAHPVMSREEVKREMDRRRKYDEGGKRIRPPGDYLKDTLTREEAMDHLASAVLAMGGKMYEQMSGEIGDALEAMEGRMVAGITQNVLQALERRTWRYRFRRWLRATAAGNALIELGVMEPPVALARAVDPVEALDPNVVRSEGPLEWRSAPEGFTGEIAAWLADGNRVAVARHPKTGGWYLMAHDTPTLERAARMLGGENPTFEDGVTSAQLDDEFTERAFAIIENGGAVPDVGEWRK